MQNFRPKTSHDTDKNIGQFGRIWFVADELVVGGAVVSVVELLVVLRRRQRLLPGVALFVEECGLGRAVGARDVSEQSG